MEAITEITDGQKKQYLRVIEDAAERALKDALIGKDGMQRVIESGGEFQADIISLIREFAANKRFSRETVFSNHQYPKEFKLMPIEKNIEIIAKNFDLDPTQALEFCMSLPHYSDVCDLAEGYIAIPKVSAVAKKHFPEIIDPKEQYCEAIKLLFKKLSDSRSFFNCIQARSSILRDVIFRGEITPQWLSRSNRTTTFLQQLEDEQSGDILIIAVQFGDRHKGESSRRAVDTFTVNEFGFGAFEVGCIALTYPTRYMYNKELDTYCPGDLTTRNGAYLVTGTSFSFRNNRLEFDDVNIESQFYGAVSGFVPQQ